MDGYEDDKYYQARRRRMSTGQDPRVDLMSLRASPLGEEIYQYLQERQRIPAVQRAGYLGAGTNGQYSWGRDLPSNGLLETIYGANNDTLTHEFAHAADRELGRQFDDRPTIWFRPETPTQFTNAYEKLVGNTLPAGNGPALPPQRKQLAYTLDKPWTTLNNDYRASNKELVGWGAGATVNDQFDQEQFRPPKHLNPTMATELSILLDLARRGDKPPPEPPGIVSRITDWVSSLRK